MYIYMLSKKDLIFLLIGFLLCLIIKNYQKITENMSDTESIDDKIRENVNKIYKADIQSIRNLSVISSKLQAGGLEVDGNLTIKNKLINNELNTKLNSYVSRLDALERKQKNIESKQATYRKEITANKNNINSTNSNVSKIQKKLIGRTNMLFQSEYGKLNRSAFTKPIYIINKRRFDSY